MKNRVTTIVLMVWFNALITNLYCQVNLLNGLQACYPLDCSANNMAATGGVLNGVVNGNVTCATGHLNNALSAMQFGGTTNDFISLPNNPLIKPTTSLTVSGWYFITSLDGQELVFAKNPCTSFFDAYYLYFAGGTFYTGMANSSCGGHVTASSGGFNVLNTWHHVVFFITPTTVKLIVDNNPPVIVPNNNPFSYDQNTGVILGGTNQGAANPPFKGRMDDVRFYTRELTAAEITDLFTNSPGCGVNATPQCTFTPTPMFGWEFNGNLNDSYGTNNGTWVGSPNPVYVADRCGRPNSAVRLNGTSQYIQTTMAGPLVNAARSVSFWMRTNNQTAGGPSVVRAVLNYGSTATGTGGRWEICHNYGCQGVGVDISNQYVASQRSCLNDNQWHHVVITQAQGVSLSAASLYIDGGLVANPWVGTCGSANNNGVNNTVNQAITIGAILIGNPTPPTPARFFQGDLDDIYVFNNNLNAAEVTQLYNCRCPITIIGPTTVCQGKNYTYSVSATLPIYNWSIPAGWNIVSGLGTNIITVQAGSNSGNIQLLNSCGAFLGTLSVQAKDCCQIPPPGFSQTPLSGNVSGSYSNNSYLISSNITLGGGTTNFQNAEFIIAQGVQIIVPPGQVLNLEHAHLYACSGNMWQGIVVQDGGQVISQNQRKGSTLIEDAVVAMDVDLITNLHATPPIDLHEVIFNKNFVGIKFSNSTAAVSTLPINVRSCVFTSKTMTFTSPAPFNQLSWPNADATPTGLRFQNISPSGLIPPYFLQGFAPSNLLAPYSTQPGHIGIKISQMGDQNGIASTSGLDMGIAYATGNNLFNLFDGIGIGIEANNSSLSTINNVFQNMQSYSFNGSPFGGIGIYHKVTALMNARLDLAGGNQSTVLGNKFWNCSTAVRTSNVFDVRIKHCIFRSNRTVAMSAFGAGIGSRAITMESNRFDYDIRNCEFNNIDTCITANMTSGSYNMGSGVTNGTYGNNFDVRQNYFGPEIASNIPLGTGYCNYAVILNGVNAGTWQINGTGNFLSNKMDRVYRGIKTSLMSNYPTLIGGNNLYLIDDNFVEPINEQFGIFAEGTQGGLAIRENTASSVASGNARVMLIHCRSNSGSNSPDVSCNVVSNAHFGFNFEGSNNNTTWSGNYMMNLWAGMVLSSNGVIGTQGSISLASSNKWWGTTWTGPGFHTYCINSIASLSPLWVVFSGASYPLFNGSSGTGVAYTPSDLPNTMPEVDCAFNTYAPTPSQKATIAAIQSNVNAASSFEIYPNPTSGEVTIQLPSRNQVITLSVYDLTGKVVLNKKIQVLDGKCSLSLEVKKGIYFCELKDQENIVSHKKLIVE